MGSDSTYESVVVPCGINQSDCGYCKSKESSVSFGVLAKRLTCDVYQQMIDRGWRRSGNYLYRPNLKESCCPAYTIRLDSSKFTPNKAQRKVVYKFQRFIVGTESKGSAPDVFNMIESLIKHPDFKVVLEKSAYSEEVFALYKKYQINVHHDLENDITPESFKRFLVESPLKYETISGDNGSFELGSFHQKYYYKGQLIAVGVLDLLPACVSSVYFMYDIDFAHLSLGKFSAMVETRLSIYLSKMLPSLKYYYMGFYIHSCPKMLYKGSYHPSYLVDPSTLDWVPFEECVKLLDLAKAKRINGFACFSDGKDLDNPPISGFDDFFNAEDYDKMDAYLHGNVYCLGVSLCH
ncbi:Arginyl-tRNA--protein transferase 1, variant 3 [Entomophthora muscae]|uniref:Arginyl-tRNA--protein transferase 1, variant 3 n=1 Tax=Entomophthora muscae TaxID=34485 RepID=A0ACC2UDE2_9FUNG|nr:Arginyl-tRNA--protein transferase 1, variant 3 [Entomophthora muscae]